MVRVSVDSADRNFCELRGCLVEGSAQQEASTRRAKRRALLVSVSAQFLFLAALVLFPLLGRGERLNIKAFTPVVPYGNPHSASTQHHAAGGHTQIHRDNRLNFDRFTTPHLIASQPLDVNEASSSDAIGDTSSGPGGPAGDPTGLVPPNTRNDPPKPVDDQLKSRKPKRVVGTLEPAQLINRIEPIYPSMAKQMRREGTVVLHAIIARDGSVQSLEVVSGDPLFIRSALDAVRQWVYRPTYLSGEPVEVDTQITVQYHLER